MSLWAYLTGAAGPSGYGSASTASQVARDHAEALRGKVVLVTGAASGIGFEAARAFAEQGAVVYVTARTEQQAEEAAERIRKAHPQATVKTLALDLSSVAAIKKSAETFIAKGDPLHILLNNAGTHEARQGGEGMKGKGEGSRERRKLRKENGRVGGKTCGELLRRNWGVRT